MLFLTDRFTFGVTEVVSVLISRHSVDSLLFHAAFDIDASPLYYLLLHDWIILLLGDSIAAVLSGLLLFGILTVVNGLSCLRDGWQMNVCNVLAGWFARLMPMAVHYSQETRMYALMGMPLSLPR